MGGRRDPLNGNKEHLVNRDEDIVCSIMKVIAKQVMLRVCVANILNHKRDILFITPHQLSTDALTLFRNGVTGFDFLDEMIGSKNYYSESKQIAQVVDGEIFLTKAKVGKKDWRLYVGKGKHRSPTITPDEDKQTMFKFPIGAPIPEDTNSELEEGDEYNEETNSDYDF